MRIKLPADIEDEELCRVLEYLYTGKLVIPTGSVHQLYVVHGLIELYVVASRFGLGILMALIVRDLEKHTFLKSNPEVLFITAERIYPATPDSDRVFKDFFVAALIACYENCPDLSKTLAAKFMMAGGTLAVDIYEAQCLRCDKLYAKIRGKLV